MAESKTKEPAPTPSDDNPTQESTASTTAAEELKKEFNQNNQHNLPRDKREAEAAPRLTMRRPNKKQYQRSRGRNKR